MLAGRILGACVLLQIIALEDKTSWLPFAATPWSGLSLPALRPHVSGARHTGDVVTGWSWGMDSDDIREADCFKFQYEIHVWGLGGLSLTHI